MKYARVNGADVIEICTPIDGFAIDQCFHPDIVVELIGGYGIALELVMSAIESGKHVVTANKALLALHGTEIFEGLWNNKL